MSYTAQFADTVEPVADTDMEVAYAANLYNVISGCAVTYDSGDLTVDVAAGQIMHNGTVVAVAAQTDAITLTADSTYPQWVYIALDNTGDTVAITGTPAAVPAKPELGDNVWLAAVKVEAAQTVANDIAVKLDKRYMNPKARGTAYIDNSTGAKIFTNDTSYADIPNLAFKIEASATYRFTLRAYVSFGGTGGVKMQFTGPGSPTAVAFWAMVPEFAGTDTVNAVNALAAVTSFSSNVVALSSASSAGQAYRGLYIIEGYVQNGTTAGTVQLQGAQNSTNSTTTFAVGSSLSWERLG